jgi:hypothetical protein
MKIVLTTFSDINFAPSRAILVNSVPVGGKEIEVHDHDFEEIKESDFYKDNQNIFKYKKGIGYWLWKPYIILQELQKLEKGDVLIYCDSEIKIIDSLFPVIQLTEQQAIVLFGNCMDTNNMWIKRDCFVLMDCDMSEYWFSPHCDAAFIILKKSDVAVSFVQEWLEYCKNENILTDLPNSCGKDNIEGFIDHRRDQAVLSLMAQKYQLNLFRMPTQFGNYYKMQAYRGKHEFKCKSQYNQTPVDYYAAIPYYNSPYYQLLDHHRTVKKQMGVKINANKKISLKVRVKKQIDRIIKYKYKR